MFLFFVIHDLIFIEINAFNNALSLINWNECNPLIDVFFWLRDDMPEPQQTQINL